MKRFLQVLWLIPGVLLWLLNFVWLAGGVSAGRRGVEVSKEYLYYQFLFFGLYTIYYLLLLVVKQLKVALWVKIVYIPFSIILVLSALPVIIHSLYYSK